MADKKISELTSITGANVSDASDTIAIVDSSAGQTKKITREELFKDVDGAEFTGAVTLVGADSGAASLYLNSQLAPNQGRIAQFNSGTVVVRYDNLGDDQTDFFFRDTFGVDGDVCTLSRGDARYAQLSSDERLKENISEMEDVGVLIDNLRPVRFNWKENENGPKPEGLMYGMIAQEVSSTSPEIARGSEETTMGIDPLSVISVLVKEVQELRKRVAEIENT